MPRKKFRFNSHPETFAERSFQEYLTNQPAPQTTRTELLRLIRGGEDTYLELKVKLSNSDKIAKGIVALANTDGGTMIFGVTDTLRIEGIRNPEEVQAELVRLCREEIYPPITPLIDSIAFDNARIVIVLDVEGKRRPYRTRDGRFYIRIGAEKREISRHELADWLSEIRPLNYENIPLQNVSETDFDDALLWSFAAAFGDDINPGGAGNYQTGEFLKKDLLLAAGASDELMPTVAGVLLFGKNETVSETLPHSKVVVSRLAGENGNAQMVETLEIKGNLLFLYESAMRFIERYCDLAKDKPRRQTNQTEADSVAAPRRNYHIFSMREAVANALVHRDLAIREIPTRVLIYDNHIEIANARRTNGFAPPASKAIRYGITQKLNPQISAIFSKREYGTNIPKGGLPMILRSSKHFADRRVEIYTANDEFKIRIYGG